MIYKIPILFIFLGMTCFMTYSVYSLNFSNLFPQQSDYLMMITAYFLLSMSWTLISLCWFVLCNHYTNKAELPKSLCKFAEFVQRILFCYFPPPKKDEKKDEKPDVITENGITKRPIDEGSTKTAVTEQQTCVSCQRFFTSCMRRKKAVVHVDETTMSYNASEKQAEINAENSGKDEKSQGNVGSDDTARAAEDKILEETPKAKCNFCNRCESCQVDFDKDKAKGKNKKDIEAKCSALNYFVFFFILLFMFVANMALWLSMAS